MQKAVKFQEDLSQIPNCPPTDKASPLTEQTLFRLVGPEKTEMTDICADDFFSHRKLGKKCPRPSLECAWASCSMILPSMPAEDIIGLTAFPNLKDKNAVVQIGIGASAGLCAVKNYHVDVWMFASFDPVAASIAVVQLDAL